MLAKILTPTLLLTMVTLSLTFAQTDFWRTMKKGQLMADDEATLKMARNMAVVGDYEALGELMSRGRLDISDGSEQVIYVKVHTFRGMMEVRKRASAKVWWVRIDAMEKDNPKLAEEKPEEEKYDHNVTEAQYLKEITDVLAKNKNIVKMGGAKIASDQARKIIDHGKKLEEGGDVVDVLYWRAAKIWLEIGFSPKVVTELMPVFADTLIGAEGAVSERELPRLIGDAIDGKKPAMEKLGLGIKNLKRFQSSKYAERKTQVIQALEKRYKGANTKEKVESEA